MARHSDAPSPGSVGVLREGEVGRAPGAATYSELVTMAGKHTVRIRIELKHGDLAQSFGTAERWDGSQWREVWTIPGSALQVWDVANVAPGHVVTRWTAGEFAPDREELIDCAQDVLA